MPHTQNPYMDFLRARANKIFYRMPYPGNAGDSLIQFATQTLLTDLGIRTTVNPAEAEVILVPGGNPTMWPSIGPLRWQELWRRYPQAEFLVGPAGFRSGYSDWAAVVNSDGRMVSGLFARDPASHRNLLEADLRVDIVRELAHDPALYLRHSGWMEAHRKAATEEFELAAFRDDHETNIPYSEALRRLRRVIPGRIYARIVRRGAQAVRKHKLQVAKRLTSEQGTLIDNDVSRQRFEVFVEVIRAARSVHTDRLHVMLLAAMLGKKIFAYQTTHGKLEGVYHHSLQNWADVTMVTA